MRKVNIEWAFDHGGNIVNIDDPNVGNGIGCECVCIECGESLIAKNNGYIKQHHFSHQGNSDCPSMKHGAGSNLNETALHLITKQIFKKHFEAGNGWKNPYIKPFQKEIYKQVKVEKNYPGSNLIFDLSYGAYYFEVVVKNKPNKEKRDYIKSHDFRVFEIRPPKDISPSNFNEFVRACKFHEIPNKRIDKEFKDRQSELNKQRQHINPQVDVFCTKNRKVSKITYNAASVGVKDNHKKPMMDILDNIPKNSWVDAQILMSIYYHKYDVVNRSFYNELIDTVNEMQNADIKTGSPIDGVWPVLVRVTHA